MARLRLVSTNPQPKSRPGFRRVTPEEHRKTSQALREQAQGQDDYLNYLADHQETLARIKEDEANRAAASTPSVTPKSE